MAAMNMAKPPNNARRIVRKRQSVTESERTCSMVFTWARGKSESTSCIALRISGTGSHRALSRADHEIRLDDGPLRIREVHRGIGDDGQARPVDIAHNADYLPREIGRASC